MCMGLCLYASIYVSSASLPVSSFKYDKYGEEVKEPVDVLGNATIGIEHKSGVFVEIDHTSGPFNGDDRGWEEYKIGVRKEIRIF